jgi:hypothetical protein
MILYLSRPKNANGTYTNTNAKLDPAIKVGQHPKFTTQGKF